MERNSTQFQYDPVGRIKVTIMPVAEGEGSSTTITTAYNDPFEVVETHSGGKSKRITKNARGQILYVQDSGADGTSAKIGFCYDIAGHRTKKSDLNDGSSLSCSDISSGIAHKDTSGKNQAYWRYDVWGHVRATSDPDLGTDRYEYNVFGDLTRRIDARGLTTTLTYDGLGRVITKKFPEGQTHFLYDSYAGSDNALGKLVVVQDGIQTKTFSYNKLGHVKQETRTIRESPVRAAEGPYVTAYEYDLLGRVTQIDYPEHPISHARMRACYSYGTAGYVTGISVRVNTHTMMPGSCNKTIVEGITYNEFGQTAGFKLGNGITTTYAYDIKGRLVNINSSGQVDGTTKTLQNAVYTFNDQNNITRVENNATEYSTSYTYGYDGLNRLTAATGNYVETWSSTGAADLTPKKFQHSYEYADNGNLLAKRTHNVTSGAIDDEWTYHYTNHQVTRIDSSKTGNSTITMGYDQSGNMTGQNDRGKHLNKDIDFDSQNRIVRVRDAHNHQLMGYYWYDEGGFRVRKSARMQKASGMEDVEILYPSKFYGLEYNADQNVLSAVNNIYLNGVRIAALNEAGATAYYLTDQVDSVSHVLDEGGHTISRMQYQPYGETFVQKGNTDLPAKYNSQELDKETNFYFYNARHYDPGIARFTSADTVVDGERHDRYGNVIDTNTQGWNRFSYAKGNPIRYKDPKGHDTEDRAGNPYGLYTGVKAHEVFFRWLERQYPGQYVTDKPIITLSKVVSWLKGDTRKEPDIVNKFTGAVYELKPITYEMFSGLQKEARDQINDYLEAMKSADSSVVPHVGNSQDIVPYWVKMDEYVEDRQGLLYNMYVAPSETVDGMIKYVLVPLDQDKNEKSEVVKAYVKYRRFIRDVEISLSGCDRNDQSSYCQLAKDRDSIIIPPVFGEIPIGVPAVVPP